MLQESSSPATDEETIDPGPSQIQEIRISEDDAPGADHTSLLPVEIWLEVFRYATLIINGRTLNYTDPFQPQQPYVSALGRNASSLSIRTKCILVQVCSSWRRVAAELLYEHVVVTSLRKAKLVIRALEQSKHTGSRNDPRFGYGHWIRHLEIQTRSRESHKLSFLQAVAYIMTQCTNLQYISGSWTNSLPKEFLAVILKYHSSTLRGLYWEQLSHSFGVGIVDGADSSFSLAYLTGFKNLRLLDLRILPKLSTPRSLSLEDAMNPSSGSNTNGLNNKLSQYPPPPPISELPNVVSLCIAADYLVLKLASMISLPKLRNVILDATYTGSDNAILDISLNSFLIIHGPSIKSLELIPVASDLSRSTPEPLGPGFFLRPSICPNLETIVFDRRERCIVSPTKYDILGPRQTGKDGTGGSSSSITGKSRHKLGVPELTAQSHIYHHAEEHHSSMKSFQEDNQVMSEPHLSLRWIGLKGFGIGRLYPNQPGHAHNHLRAFIGAYHAGLLPALERVQTVDLLGDWCGDWMGKDVFVWWAEVFESVGLDFLDGERVLWKYQEEFEDEKGKEKVEKKVTVEEEDEKIRGGGGEVEEEVRGGDDDNADRSEEEKNDDSCALELELVASKKDSEHSQPEEQGTGLPTNIHPDTAVLDNRISGGVDSDEDVQKVGLIDGSTAPTGLGGDLGCANNSGT
ncbi:hypothetical protein ABKN59_009613 [Abortiporus biennis]